MYREGSFNKLFAKIRSLTTTGVDISTRDIQEDNRLIWWMDWLRASPDPQYVRVNYIFLIAALFVATSMVWYKYSLWLYPLMALLIGSLLFVVCKRQCEVLEKEKNTLRWNEKDNESFKQSKISFIGLVFDIKLSRIQCQLWTFCLLFPLVPHLTAKIIFADFAFGSEWISLLASYMIFVPLWFLYFSSDLRLFRTYKQQAVSNSSFEREQEE